MSLSGWIRGLMSESSLERKNRVFNVGKGQDIHGSFYIEKERLN